MEKVRGIKLVRSKGLEHVPVICKAYSNLRIEKKDIHVDKWIKACIEKIKEKYSNKDWRDASIFKGYIELHHRHTAKKEIISSSEVLIDFILKKGSVPNINTFVDIYNAVSALTGVSMGAHDILRLAGTPRLEILAENQQFKIIGRGGKDIARRGEYCYVDNKGILCRMDIKQSERTKVTEKTRHILGIFQGHQYLGEDDLKKALKLLDGAINLISSSNQSPG